MSGHPRRAEVAQLYGWVRPQIAIPAHGEPLHLAEHAQVRRSRSASPFTIKARNGDLVLLAPGDPGIIDEIPHGRLCKDGNILVPANDPAAAGAHQARLRRRRLDRLRADGARRARRRSRRACSPACRPARATARRMDAIIDEAIFDTLDNLGRGKRRDPDAAATAVERAVRGAVGAAWGKKPTVHVLVVEV